jgi:hypothetical protein
MDLPKKQIDDYVGPPLVFSGSALAGASALAARTRTTRSAQLRTPRTRRIRCAAPL